MIEKLPQSDGAVIGVEVSGSISAAEEAQWVKYFDELIAEHGTINILVVLDGKLNMGLDVAYDDLKWTFKHLKNMNKLAIVSQSKVLDLLVTLDSPFGKLVGISENHFKLNELENAWSWVRE